MNTGDVVPLAILMLVGLAILMSINIPVITLLALAMFLVGTYVVVTCTK